MTAQFLKPERERALKAALEWLLSDKREPALRLTPNFWWKVRQLKQELQAIAALNRARCILADLEEFSIDEGSRRKSGKNAGRRIGATPSYVRRQARRLQDELDAVASALGFVVE